MLHEFLAANRFALIDRCRAKSAQRSAPGTTPAALEHGVPLLLDQLVQTLRAEAANDPSRSRLISGAPGGEPDPHGRSEIAIAATHHGRELSTQSCAVEQVVHDYGDLCQAVTELAIEARAPINVDEFRTLNRCLDNAIAGAVTEFEFRRDAAIVARESRAFDERLRVLAHELRGHIKAATLAVSAINEGDVGLRGATGAVLELSLLSLRGAIDRSFAEAWATAGLPAQHYLVSMQEFIADLKFSIAAEARYRQCTLSVSAVDGDLAVDADRDLLFAAVQSLLRNAFHFTEHRSEVSLSAYGSGDRVLIDVADHCGGLPPGAAAAMFLAAPDRADRSGLAMCRRSIEANNGILRVRDIAGIGCVFTIDLPRRSVQ